MNEILSGSLFFGFVLSLAAYEAGLFLRRKLRLPFLNPLLVSVVLVIVILLVSGTDYSVYSRSASFLSWLLTPATVSLAVPLYEELKVLKKHPLAILSGILCGVISSLCGVFLLSRIFGLSHAEYITLLPKSVTTAIAMPLSSSYGGFPALTSAAVIITGIFGNVTAEGVIRIFRIRSSVAKGVAIGTSSHAIGTAKALEIGSLEGAVSSMSLVVSGLVTILVCGIFSSFV